MYAPGPAGRLSRRPTGGARPRIASPIEDGGAGAARTAAHCCPPCQARFVPGMPHGLLTLSGPRLPGRHWASRGGDDRALTGLISRAAPGSPILGVEPALGAQPRLDTFEVPRLAEPRGSARCMPGSCSCSSGRFRSRPASAPTASEGRHLAVSGLPSRVTRREDRLCLVPRLPASRRLQSSCLTLATDGNLPLAAVAAAPVGDR